MRNRERERERGREKEKEEELFQRIDWKDTQITINFVPTEVLQKVAQLAKKTTFGRNKKNVLRCICSSRHQQILFFEEPFLQNRHQPF